MKNPNKKGWLIFFVLALALLAGGYFWIFNSAEEPAPAASVGQNKSDQDQSTNYLPQRWGMPSSSENVAKVAAIRRELNHAGMIATQQGKLAQWWQSAQAMCKQEAISDCRAMWLDDIAQWPNSALAASANAALLGYPQVLAAEQRQVQSMNMPLSQRLAKLSELRKSLMGEEAALAWYGREEAVVAFRAAVNEYAQTKALSDSQSQRLLQIEQLRQTHYGTFYADLKSAESSSKQFELEYRLALLDRPSPLVAAQLREQILNRHFDPLVARQKETEFRAIDQQQSRQTLYEQGLKELNRQHSNKDSEEYRTALLALQQQIFTQ